MSKHLARANVKNTFRREVVSTYLLKREEERFRIFSQAQAIAFDKGDHEEVARLEAKIKTLILE